MAVEISDGGATPHATSYADLLTKLEAFANANGWTTLEDTSENLIMQGEGLAATDEIFVGIQKYSDVPGDAYGWYIQGYTGYVASAGFSMQPGAIPPITDGRSYAAVPLWNGTIPYWFVVSGRRIIMVAKVSTVYISMYLGFYLPYATPNQYPYPLLIAGSFQRGIGTLKPRYSLTSSDMYAFWAGTNFQVRTSGGGWYGADNGTTTGMFPYNQVDTAKMRNAVDDSAVICPIEIWQNSSTPIQKNKLGELDGIYHVPGFGLSAEDTVDIGGTDYLLVPNVFRSSNSDFAAIKLA